MTGLVLEGGGMRGIYTAGVLDCLQDHAVSFPYVAGISAGACHACSYVSGQRGRNLKIADYIPDKRYMGMGNFLRTGNFFGMDFIFEDIPNRLIPFDYQAFFDSPIRFYVGAINVETGKTEYFDKTRFHDRFLPVRASMSIPGVTNIVEIGGKKYLDGGVSSPIPLEKSIQDQNDKHVIVLTQPRGFCKPPQKLGIYLKIKYHKYPELLGAMRRRHEVYNQTVKLAERLESEQKAVLIRPSKDYHIGRLEKNLDRIRLQYSLGYDDTLEKLDQIKSL